MKELSFENMENIEGGEMDCGLAIGAAVFAFASLALVVFCPPAGVIGMIAVDVAFGGAALSGGGVLDAC